MCEQRADRTVASLLSPRNPTKRCPPGSSNATGPRASSCREPRKYHDAGAGRKWAIGGTESRAARLGESTVAETSSYDSERKLRVARVAVWRRRGGRPPCLPIRVKCQRQAGTPAATPYIVRSFL